MEKSTPYSAAMATSSTVLGSLPAGMWYYSFMFGDAKPLVGGYVAEGRLPAPSSLVIGIGVGVVLSAIRALLDFALFKVGLCAVSPAVGIHVVSPCRRPCGDHGAMLPCFRFKAIINIIQYF